MHEMRKSHIRLLGLPVAVFCVGFTIAAPAQSTGAAPAQSAPAQAAPAAQVPDWKSYSFSTDGFSAVFPSEPVLQKKDVPTDAGSFQLRSYIAEVGQVALFVGVCDYGAATEGKDPEDMLQGAKDGALKNSNSHLISERKIALGVYHGVAFESESNVATDAAGKQPDNLAHFSARIYIVGSTLYQTLVVSPKDAPFPDGARFLDSFQLITRVKSQDTVSK